jgi:hypothetical protein
LISAKDYGIMNRPHSSACSPFGLIPFPFALFGHLFLLSFFLFF